MLHDLERVTLPPRASGLGPDSALNSREYLSFVLDLILHLSPLAALDATRPDNHVSRDTVFRRLRVHRGNVHGLPTCQFTQLGHWLEHSLSHLQGLLLRRLCNAR